MRSILYLLLLRAKAMVRKIYSKPSSAIITTLAIIFFGMMAFLMMTAGEDITFKLSYKIFVSAYIGFSILMMSGMLFQKRTALINETDANYLLVGPYTNKHIIAYGIIYSLSGAMMFAIMNYFYGLFFFGPLFDIKTIDYFSLFFVSILLYYIVFCFIDMLYVRLMHSKYQTIIKRLIILVIFSIVLLVFLYYYVNYSEHLEFENILMSFAASDIFNYIPIFGTSRALLLAFHNANYGIGIIYLLSLIIVAILVTFLTINTKNLDVELILEDAMWYGELRRKTKESQSNLNINLKVHEVKNIKWGKKAQAISSRLMLDMKKTRSFITKQEILLIILYLVISIFNGFNFMFYARYVTIVLLVITMSSNYNDELKHHYLYLIPDKPINKLIALLKPTIIKLELVILTMLIGGIILKPNLNEFILAFLELNGYALMFVSANIWSLRILKSNDNQVANQFIKMGIIILAIIPSIIIGLLLSIVNLGLFSLISSIVNIIVALCFIFASVGVVSGVSLVDE